MNLLEDVILEVSSMSDELFPALETANDIERMLLQRLMQYARNAATEVEGTQLIPPLTDNIARLIGRLLDQSLGATIRQAIDQLLAHDEYDAGDCLFWWTEQALSVFFESNGPFYVFFIPILLMSKIDAVPPRTITSDAIQALEQSFLDAQMMTDDQMVHIAPTLYAVDTIPDQWDACRSSLRHMIAEVYGGPAPSFEVPSPDHVFQRFLVGFIQTSTIPYERNTPFIDNFAVTLERGNMVEEILERDTHWTIRVDAPDAAASNAFFRAADHLHRSEGTFFRLQSVCHDHGIFPDQFLADVTWDNKYKTWSIRSGNMNVPKNFFLFAGASDRSQAGDTLSDLIKDLWEIGIRQFHIDGRHADDPDDDESSPGFEQEQRDSEETDHDHA